MLKALFHTYDDGRPPSSWSVGWRDGDDISENEDNDRDDDI